MAKKTPAYVAKEQQLLEKIKETKYVTNSTQPVAKPGNPKPPSAIPQYTPKEQPAVA